MHFWHYILEGIFRGVYYTNTVDSVKYGRYDFGKVKKYIFSHVGYIIVTGKPIKTFNFMSNKPIKAYIFVK